MRDEQSKRINRRRKGGTGNQKKIKEQEKEGRTPEASHTDTQQVKIGIKNRER